MRGKLLTTLVALAFASQLATAQQKTWTEIILNYHGKEGSDTTIYKDSKIEVSLINDRGEYKYLPSSAMGYSTPAQHAIPWNRAEVDKALKRKNTILKYNNLEEAMNAITQKDKVTNTYRLLEKNVKDYFDVLSDNFPKTNTGMGQKINGAEREEYVKCKAAAEKNLEVAKQNNQSTEGLDYLIKFLDEKLGAKKTILDETNRIMLTTDADGKQVYMIITQNPPSRYGRFADMNSVPITESLKHLYHDADSVLGTKIKREYRGSKIGQITLTPNGEYKAMVFIWQIGTKKEDEQFKATITETYDFTEKK